MNPGFQISNNFQNKTFLITGASGFIGGRIVERLKRDYSCKVKALVHNLNHAARIARFDIEILSGNILDKIWLEDVTKGVDYLVHCAFGNTSDNNLNKKITVDGTENILHAAVKNKVKRFIYFSTMSVYGYGLPNRCNEECSYQIVKGDFYNNDKIEAEKIVFEYIKKGLPAVILQPTIVYGPYASIWTVWVVEKLKQKQLFLIDDGKGLANPLYIDNLVDAVFLSLTKKEAIGEKFIISDGKSVSWKEFFSYYQKMIKSNRFPKIRKTYKYKYLLLSLVTKNIINLKNKFYPKPLFSTQNLLTESFDNLLHKVDDLSGSVMDKNLEIFFKDRTIFDISKAENKLKYTSRVTLKKGMQLTEKWLNYAHKI